MSAQKNELNKENKTNAQEAHQDMMIVDKGSAERFVAQAENIMDNIIELFQAESAHVKEGDIKALAEIESAKSSLVKDYSHVVEAARIYKKELSRFAPVAIHQLRNKHETFKNELNHNMATLATAKAVSETLITSVSKEAQNHQHGKTYGKSAQMNPHKTAYSGLGFSKAL